MRVVPLLLIALLVPATALATATMAIWSDTGSGLSPELTTQTGVNFTIVVTLDSDGSDALAAEFVITDPRNVFPGVFALETKKVNNTALDLGENSLGEYVMAFGACQPPGDRIEMVRVTYGDFSGVIGGQSAVLTLRGLQIGDTVPSTFNGSPGFVACDTSTNYLAEMGGHENEGALCINCFDPPGAESTMTELKSKF
jgi:hypothetical protein